ncbi:50S ribosomal protein L6 [Desulfurivibrio alkaliphilus]|uniref:Large ribosomal subunit protein uL6 n=1 Tax=Desulfurivibrio alkaliphilus (strain DSM 19089 / UNIQEM U267 / AHT2) TaxID=589865 RepID=D6Z3K7_DESAT|nr:50S ribosomal protein L6 [Desulfurivibrio alkaliphilus]ADH86132.1 ribosomal protein L6 [Desulfurivibrio alkaliphilus AHT 2]
MSRIGREPITVPDKVKVDIKGSQVTVTGPKGSLDRQVRPEIALEQEDGRVMVKAKDSSQRTIAFTGLTRTLINNMVIGVEKGFEKKLVVEGVGYRVEVKGDALNLNVGYSNPVHFPLPEGVSAAVEKNTLTLQAMDKELLGETAARIRAVRKPEPYKGKGIRYEDERIVRKAGKTKAK